MSPSQPRSSERGTPLVLEDSSHWRNCAQLHWSPSTSDPTKNKTGFWRWIFPFHSWGFSSHLSATLSGRQVPSCQGTSCQTHMAGHSFWHGGMVPSEPPNGRSQERPWLKKTQRYPRTHSWHLWLVTWVPRPGNWRASFFEAFKKFASAQYWQSLKLVFCWFHKSQCLFFEWPIWWLYLLLFAL